MGSELILWGALGILIALMALAVWAGRRGLHALGVVGPGRKGPDSSPDLVALTDELRVLNGNLERLIALQEKKAMGSLAGDDEQREGGRGGDGQ
ncbi:MAG: hypothetical protein ACFB01_09925 [Cohaesibacteraceae bacterium]